MARRLGDPVFTRHIEPLTASKVTAFFESPKQFLADTLASLDEASLSALGLVFVSRGWLPSPIMLNQSRSELLERLGGTIADVTRALTYMEGSLVANVMRDGQPGWVFAHPTMIDAYADRIRTPELLHLLLDGFDTAVLVSRTTCGDTGLTNAIVLPEPLWPAVIGRLDEALKNGETPWQQRDRYRSYLAAQCVPAFQHLYLEDHPELLDELLLPELRLELDSGSHLVASLYRNGVLPEQARADFVQTLIDLCIYGGDGAVLWETDFRDMLTSDEEHTLRERLITEVVPDPEIILENFTDGFPADEDPADFTRPIEEFAVALFAEFEGDATVEEAAAALETAREEWIRAQGWPGEREDELWRYHTRHATRRQAPARRSVFDDLVGGTHDGPYP